MGSCGGIVDTSTPLSILTISPFIVRSKMLEDIVR